MSKAKDFVADIKAGVPTSRPCLILRNTTFSVSNYGELEVRQGGFCEYNIDLDRISEKGVYQVENGDVKKLAYWLHDVFGDYPNPMTPVKQPIESENRN